MKAYLKQYCEYVRNAGDGEVTTAQFREDWEPIGDKLIRDMLMNGLITVGGGTTDTSPKITLTKTGREMAEAKKGTDQSE